MAGIRIGGTTIIPQMSLAYSFNDDVDFLYNVWLVVNGTPTNITGFGTPEGDNSISNPLLSPDRTMIAYNQENGPGFGENIMYVISSSGGTPLELDAVLNEEVLHPYWRPDSGKIVYTVGDNSDYDGGGIYEINPDGTGKNLLLAADTGADEGFVRPQYNRDGTKIAYGRGIFAGGAPTSCELRIMDADGSNDALVVSLGVLSQEGSFFAFANTSDRIAYTDGGTSEAYTIDPDGTNQTQISTTGPASYFIPKTAWAPDDSYLIGNIVTTGTRFDPAGGGETDLSAVSGEDSYNVLNKRSYYLHEGRVYFLQSPPNQATEALVSFLPDGTDFRVEHLLSDTGGGDWSGGSGIELL